MTCGGIFILFLCYFSYVTTQVSVAETIVIESAVKIAETDENFVCATLDWWPPEKCNYNQCPWGESSVLNLDLNHPFLANAIRAFNPLRIRIGGSLQDQVVYNVGHHGLPCHPFRKTPGGLFGFSRGCLLRSRWDELNLFFIKTGAILTFGLNALFGRHPIRKGVWTGAWNSSNAENFIEYSVAKGYPVDSWEFGNELSGSGVEASVNAQQYAKDLIKLKDILNKAYKQTSSRPLLLAPGGFYDQQWYTQLLQISGINVVNVITHHIYNLGSGDDPNLDKKILDPLYLSQISSTFRNLQLTLQNHGPWASAWVGESGGAYNSGGRYVSNTFVNSFWYLDQLGMASKYNTKAYCRQTLIGGNYGLLDRISFVPNPDYFSALLWHRLMGKTVIGIRYNGSPFIRAYAHCSKRKAGITLLLLNLHNHMEYAVSVINDEEIHVNGEKIDGRERCFNNHVEKIASLIGEEAVTGPREEYRLSPEGGNLRSKKMLLNGKPLELTEDGNIPELKSLIVDSSLPLSISPLSIAFISFPSLKVQACA